MSLKALILATAMGLSTPALAGPLASVFSDHAVLQRDQPIRVWGLTAPNATVAVDLSGQGVTASADADGRWSAVLPARPAGGGALTLTARAGDETQTVSNLVMGDVWLCSGQSNMEYPLRQALNGDGEVASAGDPDIRLLQTGKISRPAPQDSLPAGVVWKVSTPQTAANFSAACVFMGRELRKTTGVPIGLIDATWGGSVIQDWISREGLAALKTYDEGLSVLSDYARDPALGVARWSQSLGRWAGAKIPAAKGWEKPDFDDRAWKPMPTEGFWEQAAPDLAGFDGTVWLRLELTLTKAQAAQGATLALGPVDDIDTTFLNGREIGSTQGWDTPRTYRLAPGALKAGRNVLALRVIDMGGGGGPWGKAALKGLTLADGTFVPLPTAWRYKIAAPLSQTALPPSAPWLGASGLTTLRNGMIAPLVPFGVKGFAWYQGEANVTEAQEYARLMPAMIADWRAAFGGGNQPFLLTQLAAFGPEVDRPVNSAWAALRDVQRQVAAADPMVGMASAVDVGSPYDIHPADKARVGQRLALHARKLAYGEAVVASGPAPLSARREGETVMVTLDQPAVVHAGNRPIGFELCDAAACRFVDATVEGGSVRLAAPAGMSATKVRYAWADSPIINLFGANRLPATPFELVIP
ncbi:sialate O-acetylesterase [Caulobacter vibrioides]|uniref:sialate O-acetylesterase n=1 Tax=Caulobacter vibrioides TaxID=155892 RepID=UPI000BB4EDCE|nr:sialate O-acetylesterase [Caulobacter vibrioides]ATC23770.1 sialate O-acetylesterase [Caulobacter vibrioides]AZH12009.1 sialate O-acetylesterase [Caulobacter vibrioides]PLR16022.1 sialate O-acetylesterase [Caulobacter vibrioides]